MLVMYLLDGKTIEQVAEAFDLSAVQTQVHISKARKQLFLHLERQLTMANLAASQTAQTARILADNAAQTVALEQYLNPTPVPSYTVPSPYCCNQYGGCGCGS